MALAAAWIVLPAVLLAGVLIGASGIGGVLLVPVLTRLGGVPAAQAIAASSLAFLLPGLVALAALRRQPALPLRTAALPLLAGGLAGAAAGALLVHWLPARALLAGVTALVLFAGVRGLLGGRRPAPGEPAMQPERAPLRPATWLALGLLVGAGSALTGTGGPVLVLPVLMLLRQPLVLAVAAAQAIQLPVALSSSAMHAAAGQLDFPLALLCGAVMMAGAFAGQRLASRLDPQQLQRLVSLLLLGVGAWFCWLLLA